eukprot:12417983-Karenia_brevis.AAC.2
MSTCLDFFHSTTDIQLVSFANIEEAFQIASNCCLVGIADLNNSNFHRSFSHLQRLMVNNLRTRTSFQRRLSVAREGSTPRNC